MCRSILFITILTVIILSSCQTDITVDNTPEIENSVIPIQLQSYFETFKSKGEDYGVMVDYDQANITAEIKLINEGSVAGSCTTNGHDLRHITIDQTFWNQASELLREMVIFHELGHCILGRGHREDSFSNGICRSIMRSGLGNCRDAYISTNREYYIQELFTSQD